MKSIKSKRAISLLLSLALCASLALPGAAQATDLGEESTTADVSAAVTDISYDVMERGVVYADRGATVRDMVGLLPTEVQVTLTDGTVSRIPITWNCDPADQRAYEADPAGVSLLTFVLALTEGCTLAEGYRWEDLPRMLVSLEGPGVSTLGAGDTFTFTTTRITGTNLITDKGSLGVNAGTIHTDQNGNTAYCFAQGRATPSESQVYTFLGYADERAAAILDAGYPNHTTIGGMALDANQARQATQAALWCVSPYNKSGDISIDDLRTTGRAGAEEALAAAQYLVSIADQGSDSLYGLYKTGESGYQVMLIPANEKPPVEYTQIRLVKRSANPGITGGNGCYSLEGAVYGVYSDAGCTQLVTTITTDVNGAGATGELEQGSYWLKEITASPGYQLDATVYPVTADTTQVSVTVAEEPANDPVGLTLTKIAAGSDGDVPSLEGAQFTVCYYDGQYSALEQLPAAPTRTWVVETKYNEATGMYLAILADDYKVSGDDFYHDPSGTSVVLPLGTVTVQETKPPEGYTLEGSYINDTTGQTVSDSKGVVLLNITQDGEGGTGYLRGGNAYTKQDTEIRGGVKICKRDAETGANIPQGDATLTSAQFEIVNRTGRTISVNGGSYADGAVVYTGGTDASGLFQTASDLLPAGHYELREQTPPTGYTTSGTISRAFDISEHGVIVDLTAPENSISNEIIRGGVKLYKYDTETEAHTPQGGATVQGAVFEIVNRSANAVLVNGVSYASGEVVYAAKTDDSGLFQTAADLLPYGTYEVREVSPPTGYTGDGTTSRTFSIEQNGVIVDLTDFEHAISNEVIRGGIKLYKYDIESQEHVGQGEATVAGAKFEIVNRTGGNVVVNGITYTDGQVVYTGYTDENGLFETAADLLPYGHYEVREAVPPSGYTADGVISQAFDIVEDGAVVDLIDFDHSISNRIIRGDFELRKVDGDTQTALAGVPFKITNDATGETHYFVTDENGYYSSAASWISHTQDTNGGTVDSGLWFGAGEPDDSVGALPYGTYTLEEQPCEANEDYILWTGTLTISRDGYTVDFNNIENLQMRMSTSAVLESTNSQWGPAESGAVIVDTVRYENLLAATSYTLVGTLVDQATGAVLTDAEGNPISVIREFTTTTRNGSLRMEFVLDGSALAGQSLVVCQTLYLGLGEEMSEEPVLVHADLADQEQTVHFPAIDTHASNVETGDHVAYAQNPVTIADAVSYTNLQPGRNYQLTGTLMDADTGLPVYDANGNPITATTSFQADAADGTVDNTFVFDGSIHGGKTLVVYEFLSMHDTVYATHTDLTDPDQTMYIPEIATTAIDAESGDHTSIADETVTILDEVFYSNLIAGEQYTVNGVLYVRSTGEPLVDAQGNPVAASTTFTAEKSEGSVTLTFSFDGSLLAGETVVAFESLRYKGIEVGTHADMNDADQSVSFPGIHTNAVDQASGTHRATAGSSVTILDTVTYTNLRAGQTYTLVGTLMDKTTGLAVTDAQGQPITTVTAFVAEAAEGSVEVSFTFDASSLAGYQLVVFEALYQGEDVEAQPVAVHQDWNDEGQTVEIIVLPAAPETGDAAPILGCAAALLATGCALAALWAVKKRRKGSSSEQ